VNFDNFKIEVLEYFFGGKLVQNFTNFVLVEEYFVAMVVNCGFKTKLLQIGIKTKSNFQIGAKTKT
jgi:hypothetical protein